MHHSLSVSLNTIKGAPVALGWYLTRGEKELLDDQHPVHGKMHDGGLLFGYAADPCTEPDWCVLPDGHLPDAQKLLTSACIALER